MTKPELLQILKSLKDCEPEMAHVDADDALLKFINDPEITEAFEEIKKWYA